MQFVFDEELFTILHERIDRSERLLVDAIADEEIESVGVRKSLEQIAELRVLLKKAKVYNDAGQESKKNVLSGT